MSPCAHSLRHWENITFQNPGERSCQSSRHGGSLAGLSPQTKLQDPPNWNLKHSKSVEFLSIFIVKRLLHERKAPPLTIAKPPYWQLSGDGSGSCPPTTFFRRPWPCVVDMAHINLGIEVLESCKRLQWRSQPKNLGGAKKFGGGPKC